MRSRTSLFFQLLKEGHDPLQIIRHLLVRDALEGCERILDVGCGSSLDMRRLAPRYSVGIEAYPPVFEEAQRKKTHDEVILGDVRELDRHFQPGQFEACLSVDVIEHITKEEGLKMMRDMERIATRKIVIVTPSGWLPQRHLEEGDLQEHFSGWDAGEMESYGYKVIGMLGPKALRGEYHSLKYRPKVFWGMISLLGHLLWTKRHPADAASILCLKTKPSAAGTVEASGSVLRATR